MCHIFALRIHSYIFSKSKQHRIEKSNVFGNSSLMKHVFHQIINFSHCLFFPLCEMYLVLFYLKNR